MPADGACQLRESTSETSARAAGLILVGNEATEAHPPVYVRTVMCFRLQTVVWKFLWRDWTFHWRIVGEQAHEAVLKKPSVRPNTAPPQFVGNLQGRAVRRSWSSHEEFYEALTMQTEQTSQNVIDPPSASGPVSQSL